MLGEAGIEPDPELRPPAWDQDACRALEKYLRSSFTYTLDTPSVRAGQDPIEAFLFEHRTGHCEYFASAMAAANAHRIRLGTSVFSAPFHHPFHLAERMCFLDHLTSEHGAANDRPVWDDPYWAKLWPMAVLIGAVLTLATAGLFWWVRLKPAAPSVAVLPFEDLSEKKNYAYLSDGMAEEILNALMKVRGLRVAGRTSSFQFRDHAPDIQTIAKTLKVATILEGTVRPQGERARRGDRDRQFHG